MKVEVLTTQWAHDGGVLAGGVHDIDNPSKKLLGQAALAESVGSIKVTASADERATMNGALEADSVSLKKLNKAVDDSTWHEGNLGDFIAVKTSLLRTHGDELDAEAKANLEHGIAQAKQILKVMGKQKTKDYDAAVTEVLGG